MEPRVHPEKHTVRTKEHTAHVEMCSVVIRKSTARSVNPIASVDELERRLVNRDALFEEQAGNAWERCVEAEIVPACSEEASGVTEEPRSTANIVCAHDLTQEARSNEDIVGALEQRTRTVDLGAGVEKSSSETMIEGARGVEGKAEPMIRTVVSLQPSAVLPRKPVRDLHQERIVRAAPEEVVEVTPERIGRLRSATIPGAPDSTRETESSPAGTPTGTPRWTGTPGS